MAKAVRSKNDQPDIIYFDDLIIYPLGGEINAKASHESLWKQVLRGTNEGRRVQ